MKQIITDVDGYSNFIINLEDLDIDIRIKYILYSVIDALINKVSENIKLVKIFGKNILVIIKNILH